MSGAGYKSKAGFRLVGFDTTDLAYLTSPLAAAAAANAAVPAIGAFDQIPFTKETVQPNADFELDPTLLGNAGYTEMYPVSRLPGGNIEMQGKYLGLNQIIAAAMGYERVRTTTLLESPDWPAGITGVAEHTATGGSVSTVVNSGGGYTPNLYVDMWLRIQTLAASPNLDMEVRRIVSNTSTTFNVTPNFVTAPGSGDKFSVMKSFIHYYELSKHMHRHLASDVVTLPWNNNARFVRWATVGITKDVSVHEWQAVYIESLEFKISKKGIVVIAEVLPFWVSYQSAAQRNGANAAVNWGVSTVSTAITNVIKFSDCKFRLGTAAASNLSDSDNIGVDEVTIKIKNNLQADVQTLLSGLYREEPGRDNKREITGTFSMPRHLANTQLSRWAAGTTLMGEIICKDPSLFVESTINPELHFFLRSLKLQNPKANVEGPKMFPEKYTFQCFQPDGTIGGNEWPTPSIGAENGELIIKTRDNCPFNFFMGQHQGAY